MNDQNQEEFMTSIYHIPALLKESVDGLNIQPSGTYVDVTFGGGGHSREILRRLNKEGRLIVFDQDDDALKNGIDDSRVIHVKGNFRFLKNFLRFYQIPTVDGIIADLGVSFYHFDNAERGFSFRQDSILDMRMNKTALRSAGDILNDYSINELADVFYFYGELRNARRIARTIVEYRENKSFVMISDFLEVLKSFTKHERDTKLITLAFQALRIEVNDELQALKDMLQQGEKMLKPQGRLSVISYHSLEDRLVKNFFRSGNFEGRLSKDFFGNIETPFEIINRKVIVPSDEEVLANPRSRSAKLRIAEKVR